VSHHKYVSHHSPPEARGGTETVELPKTFHSAYHTVFQDLKGQELIRFIVELHQLMERQDKVTSREIHDLRQDIKGDD